MIGSKLLTATLLLLACAASAQPAPPDNKPDATLRSTPETVVWGYILTGPIYVEEAEPGDMLEVRILALDYRVPYGVNNSNRGTGVLPELLGGPTPKVIRLDTARKVLAA